MIFYGWEITDYLRFFGLVLNTNLHIFFFNTNYHVIDHELDKPLGDCLPLIIDEQAPRC